MKNLSQPATNIAVDIMFVSHTGSIVGGAERSLLDLVIYLKGAGINPYVVIPESGDFTDKLANNNIHHHILDQPWWAKSVYDTSPFNFTSSDNHKNVVVELVKLIGSLTPRLCVTNTLVVPWLAYAAALTSTRHAWVLREFGSLDHGLKFSIGEDQTLRTIDALSDVVFCNSKASAAYFGSKFVLHQRPKLLYPHVQQPTLDSIKTPYRPSAIKLVIVGQIKPQKGQMDAVKATKLLKDTGRDVQLLVVGREEDEAYFARLKSYVRDNELGENVTFLGFQRNPATYVALADIVFVCSENEAFGRVTVEGMMLGKPVIGVNSAGTAEIISDGETGLLYKSGDVRSLFQSTIKLINNPPEVRSMGSRAKEVALKKYSADTCYKDFLNYYKNLLNKSSALDLSPLISILEDSQALFSELHAEISDFKHRADEQDKFIDDITHSKSWRIAETIRKLLYHS